MENIDFSCALCNAEPHVHCESDEAFLCYDCDARVHQANFLVARHTRAILCCKCKSPTQVHASGPTVHSMVTSTCNVCADSVTTSDADESVSGSGWGLDLNSCPEEEEGESQVVPEPVEVAVTVTGWKRRRGSDGLVDQEDSSCYSTSDPGDAESLCSDDDATSLSSDSNPRAHKRSFFLNVVLSSSVESGSSYSRLT